MKCNQGAVGIGRKTFARSKAFCAHNGRVTLYRSPKVINLESRRQSKRTPLARSFTYPISSQASRFVCNANVFRNKAMRWCVILITCNYYQHILFPKSNDIIFRRSELHNFLHIFSKNVRLLRRKSPNEYDLPKYISIKMPNTEMVLNRMTNSASLLNWKIPNYSH